MVIRRRLRPSSRRRPARAGGYNLVILMVLVTVMNVLVAVALPAWSHVIQRQKEQELVFRGLQYAEAIRVFHLRQGRFPNSLKELLEIEPRSIRQLWTDPFRDDGKWGLVLAQQARGQQIGGQAIQGSAPDPGLGADELGREDEEGDGRPPVPVEDVSRDAFGAARGGEVVATGPIVGVKSLTSEEATRTFLGSQQIDSWEFVAELIPILPNAPGIESVPRLTSAYIGRPFPEDLQPQSGTVSGIGGAADGDTGQARPQQKPDRERENRRNRPTGGQDG